MHHINHLIVDVILQATGRSCLVGFACAVLLLGTAVRSDAQEQSLSASESQFNQGVLRATILDSARTVRDQFVSGQLDADLMRTQEILITGLRLLIQETSGPPAGRDASGTGSQGSAVQMTKERPPEDSGAAGGGTTSAPNESTTNRGNLRSREDLRDAVWGHLPPQERNDLLNTYSESYLPGYEAKVRRYFELLARSREHRAEPTQVDVDRPTNGDPTEDQGSR